MSGSGRRGQVHLGWRRLVLASVVVAVAGLAVAPTRNLESAVLSRGLLYATAPFAPRIGGLPSLDATTRVVAADGSVLALLDGDQRRQPVHLAQLPPQVIHAVLAAEDANFYSEAAVDPLAILRATASDVTGGSSQGGSTITQQLAKMNYVGGERSMLRKLKEVLYADELARRYSKDTLLERYLNQVYLGRGAYGIAAGALTFFGERPEQLTVPQAAMLAGKIRAPETLDPVSHPAPTRSRRNEVLQAMYSHGWIGHRALVSARAAPLGVHLSEHGPAQMAPEFVSYVEREAAGLAVLGDTPDQRLRALRTGGYTVDTTLNLPAYRTARAAVAMALGRPADPTAAVVSVQPGDGAIRVLFGGLHDNAGGFDPASQGHRQPGSAFKPFVYLAALQAGIDPRSVFPAWSPMSVQFDGAPYTVHNYEGGGPLYATVDQALAQSINAVFAQLVVKVGPMSAVRIAEEAGLPTSIDKDAQHPSVALGALTSGVSPLEMAEAYATLAAKGTWAAPYAISKIVDRKGSVVYEHVPESRPAIDPDQVGVLTAAMEGVVQHGTGTTADIGRPLAGKTGTSEDFADAWFIGFTPQLSTAVWVGYPDSRVPMTDVHGIRVAGATFPALIFSTVMRAALAGQVVEAPATTAPDVLALLPSMTLRPGDIGAPLGPGLPGAPAAAPNDSTTTTSTSSTSTTSSTTSTTSPTTTSTSSTTSTSTTTTAPPPTTTTTAGGQ